MMEEEQAVARILDRPVVSLEDIDPEKLEQAVRSYNALTDYVWKGCR
jgi:hypothetical protein